MNSLINDDIKDVDSIIVDLLVVGSGTGMAAALTGNEKGLKCLVIEKTALVGGSTARSGGAFWIPANPILKKEGSTDNLQLATTYLSSVVGSSADDSRWKAFLKNGRDTVEMLSRTTPLKFFWAKGYSDYHPEKPGGDPIGRTCESLPFDLNILGEEATRLRPGPMAAPIPMPVTGFDYKWLNLMVKKPLKAIPVILKRVFQGIGGLLIGKKYVAGGQAIAGGMFAGLLRANIPVWTETELLELIWENNQVIGVVVKRNGSVFKIQAKKGVVLASGGFDHNMKMRQEFQSPLLKEDLSLGAQGNTGDALNFVKPHKIALGSMVESWWFPAVAPLKKGGYPQILLAERSLPGSFMVNGSGQRFINESTDYMSFGQKLLQQNKDRESFPEMWLVFDQSYKNSYLLAGTVFPAMPIPKEWYDAKIAFSAESPSELAEAIGVPKAKFAEALLRFNNLSDIGKDTDFGRGDSAYDRYYGDPTVTPNPNLRPLKGKLYAVKVVLSDLGTCGGIATDEYGRVLRSDNSAVNGLYAIGNVAANVFGHVYPGAGATIGQGLVFGYIAASHAAAQ